jgi:hypothetical protein
LGGQNGQGLCVQGFRDFGRPVLRGVCGGFSPCLRGSLPGSAGGFQGVRHTKCGAVTPMTQLPVTAGRGRLRFRSGVFPGN